MTEHDPCNAGDALDLGGFGATIMNLSTTMAAMAMTGLVLATIPTPAEAQSATERFEQCADDWYAAYSVGWDKLGMYERHCCDGGQPDQYCAGTLEARQNIQRWLTRGGVISDLDLDKLVKAFSLVTEQAERHGVDVAVGMMPWNYTNTTGNFRRVAERVGSRRLKVMWGPADNTNCGEWDVATAGFHNVRPYLYGLHLKDVRVNDGLNLDFDYCPIGEGDTDYPTILRNLRDHGCSVYLSLSTHFQTPSGSGEEAMRINCANMRELIRQVEEETSP